MWSLEELFHPNKSSGELDCVVQRTSIIVPKKREHSQLHLMSATKEQVKLDCVVQ
jgi:hypothetical protein